MRITTTARPWYRTYHLEPWKGDGTILGTLVDENGEYFHHYREDAYVVHEGGYADA